MMRLNHNSKNMINKIKIRLSGSKEIGVDAAVAAANQ